MVCVTHPYMATINSGQKIEQDRIEISKVEGIATALKIVETITARREANIAQLVASVREKRIARNRWLPSFFKYSLDESDILNDHITQKAQIFFQNSAIMGSGGRILGLCNQTKNSTVSVIRRDWSAVQRFQY